MDTSRDAKFAAVSADLGYSFDDEIKVGGNYAPLVEHGNAIYVSGQVPRVGDSVVVTGKVGAEVTLEQAQLAARICVMRALALLRQALGSLDGVTRILRMCVFVQSDADFTQQSEVADAASEVLYTVLGTAGVHARSSVGVMQLPKDATVELDLVAASA